MAVWMDMTNSMHVWKGGAYGPVRAELEIARGLKHADPDVRFCKYADDRFVEIADSELAWLWGDEPVGDAYLEATGNTLADKEKEENEERQLSLRESHPKLESAYNYSDSRLLRVIQGLMIFGESLPRGINKIVKLLIWVLTWPLRFASEKISNSRERKKRSIQQMLSNEPSHPFSEGDTIFSCGSMSSGKEKGFARVKQSCPNIDLVYLVYNLAPIRENTRQWYSEKVRNDFTDYINWISLHCNAVLCGGENTLRDLRDYQKAHYLPQIDGCSIALGADVLTKASLTDTEANEYIKQQGLNSSFILVPETQTGCKNYATLYRAMTIMAEKGEGNCPQIVIVGKYEDSRDLLDTMREDPLVNKKIIFVLPNDKELDWLYRNAAFVALPAAWEGWSVSFAQALKYKKLVLASDVAPLREVGRENAVYIDTYDPFAWAEMMEYYCRNLPENEAQKHNWEAEDIGLSWDECGAQIHDCLKQYSINTEEIEPTIYMDISLAYYMAQSGGNITGILRTELMLIRNLYRINNKMKFFSLTDFEGYKEIDVTMLMPIITGKQLDLDFKAFRERIVEPEDKKTQNVGGIRSEKLNARALALWYVISAMPVERQDKWIAFGRRYKKMREKHLGINANQTSAQNVSDADVYDVPFKKGDIVFTAGTGSGADTYEKLLRTKEKIGYIYCPIIYDFTPIVLPQVHKKESVELYSPFIDFTSEMADLILYGGETARKDGIAYQRKNKLPEPRSCAIRFGSDISERKAPKASADGKQANSEAVLKRLGLNGPYIMAVGTMEVRKNYETLYRAYLRMMDEYEDIPQLVFCGHPGWKTKDFLATLDSDRRVEHKILHLSPTDEELEILYNNCEFTVLASMYEGWSLTLPESYWYGKFCLCCDTPALKETAGELAEYVHRWDEKRWAERIHYFHTNPDALREKEKAIKENWHTISWAECAQNIQSLLEAELVRAADEAAAGKEE